ncbi:hypothetical protein PHYBLDRAFT_145479 [Phycomyces blakesleeanus NRRL 1555(-)]|uniref:Tc1-like transposase DDE domain-containing protein n=1 Tax=Phycomyces blakesleeanus (strain ATCC 8743b / DSM 1359 / FGSC 10004 / NBRC 33097 / NRRL 1555) TaxID=763407 RepID=A0A162PU70_PHYB8|nr:hypothetical protein PHYBLDRAFT_145479 [Phycomyces blakesleeanus NRRL 1555(-)]OAD74016.1 hypothetical protein PHYBLDRAFT_145479 [Phycomyces blakesleeanus NRRL 1555(-)]|eukprot:XP_018292056.1 hypothetical protein PHYBLDRAFT_145479 [Phycomyces blakesleeanus NRRL 1555(-)]
MPAKSIVSTSRDTYITILGAISAQGVIDISLRKPTTVPATVSSCIEKRGYRCIYLAPYSPFLNPIEEFWSKVKFGVKREAFDNGDKLTPKIVKSCSEVALKDCLGWIRHSVSFFERCLALEEKR